MSKNKDGVSDRSNDPTVTGYLWWSNHLEVGVHDPMTGKTFRVQFEQAIYGDLRHSGGGGFDPHTTEKSRFDRSKDVAAEWVRETFGHDVVPDSEWGRIKDHHAKRILEQSEEYEVRSLHTESVDP